MLAERANLLNSSQREILAIDYLTCALNKNGPLGFHAKRPRPLKRQTLIFVFFKWIPVGDDQGSLDTIWSNFRAMPRILVLWIMVDKDCNIAGFELNLCVVARAPVSHHE